LRGDGDASGFLREPIARASLSKLRSRLDILPTDFSGRSSEYFIGLESSFRSINPGDPLALGNYDVIVILGDFLPIEDK